MRKERFPFYFSILVIWAVFYANFFGCLTTVAGDSNEVPPAPFAEIFFSPYNPSMNERRNRNGETLESIIVSLSKNDPHRLLERREELREDEEWRGFCFASIGCWGGDIPHSERQTKVRDQLFHVLENGVNFSKLGVEKIFFPSFSGTNERLKEESNGDKMNKTMARDSLLYPVHFVLAAGDNFYPAGVSTFRDLAFYTTFESFYASKVFSNVSNPHQVGMNLQALRERENVMRIPWIVALGNHDAIQNSEAEVQYTYDSIEEADALAVEWREQINESIRRNDAKGYSNDPSLQHRWRSGKAFSPTGRWYMPDNHYAIMVSPDMVVIVLDVPEMHRCAIFQKDVGTDHLADEDSQVKEDKRTLNIRASKEDCVRSNKQQEDVSHWLLKKYKNTLYKVVLGHYPMAGNGPHPNYPFLVNWLQPLLEQSCATMYIHADNHYLQVSRNDLQYYAGTGAGAGNRGKLHQPGSDGRPFWYHPKSEFQSIQGGFMVHCALHSEGKRISEEIQDGVKTASPSFITSSSFLEPRQRFVNFVIGEDGQNLFSFEADLDGLQQCRKADLKATYTSTRTDLKKGETLKRNIRAAKQLIGMVFLVLGCRLLAIYGRLKQCVSKMRLKWFKKWWGGVGQRRNPRQNISDPWSSENVILRSPVQHGMEVPALLFASPSISPQFSPEKSIRTLRFATLSGIREKLWSREVRKVIQRGFGYIFCCIGMFCIMSH